MLCETLFWQNRYVFEQLGEFIANVCIVEGIVTVTAWPAINQKSRRWLVGFATRDDKQLV